MQYNKITHSDTAMPSDASDADLVAASLLNDEHAFELLIKRHITPVYNFVFHLVGARSDADDITQETFIKVWNYLKKFDKKKNFKTWVLVIAKNTYFDWFRKKKDIVFSELEISDDEHSFAETLRDPSPLPDELLVRSDIGNMLNLALQKIPIPYRTIILLRYIEGYTLEEIGSILDKPLNTVKSSSRRALLLLRDVLENDEAIGILKH